MVVGDVEVVVVEVGDPVVEVEDEVPVVLDPEVVLEPEPAVDVPPLVELPVVVPEDELEPLLDVVGGLVISPLD